MTATPPQVPQSRKTRLQLATALLIGALATAAGVGVYHTDPTHVVASHIGTVADYAPLCPDSIPVPFMPEPSAAFVAQLQADSTHYPSSGMFPMNQHGDTIRYTPVRGFNERRVAVGRNAPDSAWSFVVGQQTALVLLCAKPTAVLIPTLTPGDSTLVRFDSTSAIGPTTPQVAVAPFQAR